MRRISILITTLSLALSALVALPGTESALPVTKTTKPSVQLPVARQWQVKNDDTVKASTPYELHNTYRRQLDLSSQLGFTKDGRLLGWVGQSGGHFEFRRPNIRDHRTVSPSEYLALYNTKSRGYLTGKTAVHWSSSPSYEWQVLDRQGADFALFNTDKRDYIVAADGGGSILKWLGTR